MPRHENTPLHADNRLNRHGPDVLPTHRQCSGCSKVMPLTVEHFYEDSSRYPWNLSRFRFVCRACSVRIGGELRAKRKVERNTQTRARRAQVKQNAKMARAYGSGPASADAFRVERASQAAARKVRLAWFKRQANRLRGPYQDPIKRMIREWTAAAGGAILCNLATPPHAAALVGEKADCQELLRSLRTRHRVEMGTPGERD